MEEIEFNLLEEPWIRVMTEDCTVRECSLTEVLVDSHKYRRLSGELPTQDVAILRLLLAVLHTVFYRYDRDGNEAAPDDRIQLLSRWTEVWQDGKMPEKGIRSYLDAWKDRFWLFHPERPFYQAPGAEGGTEYTAAKLNGELSESSNKIRLFAGRAGAGKQSLDYGEAARWLMYLNGFDDTSAKPKAKGLPSPGAGWMGQLGLIWAEGRNLFETLMLNLVLLRPEGTLWAPPKPVWEREKPKNAERTEIALPDNQPELLTLQSRRLLLIRERDRVTGYKLLGGDFFSKINADAEQMTVWKRVEAKKNEPAYRRPRRWTPERQSWRDFGVIVGAGSKDELPGVVSWITKLKKARMPGGGKALASDSVVHFRTAGVNYGDKDFFVADILQDHLDFRLELLDEAGKNWVDRIQQMIDTTDKAAWMVGKLAESLYLAGGGQTEDKAREAALQQGRQDYYNAVDLPFRSWLLTLDPKPGDGQDTVDRAAERWRKEGYSLALALGKEMVHQAGENAFVGHWIKDSGTDKNSFYSAPSAYNRFAGSIWGCFEMSTIQKEAVHE